MNTEHRSPEPCESPALLGTGPADPIGSAPEVAQRWSQPPSGKHYQSQRWRNARARNRDRRLLAALCEGQGVSFGGPWLDAACGTGRLSGAFGQAAQPRYLGLDVALPMLAEHPCGGRVVQGSVFELPFVDGAFEFVLACRLLHHLRDDATRRAALAELARVSSRWLAVSFWDAGSWPGRRRLRGHRASDRRRPFARALLEEELDELGYELVATRTSLRWITMQTWGLARARTRTPARGSTSTVSSRSGCAESGS